MNKRRAITLGVVVAGVVVYRHRRRRRAPFPLHAIPIALAVANQARAAQGIDLSPSTLISGIGGFFSGVVMTLIGDIVAPIANAISWAAQRLEDWADALFQVVVTLVGTLPGTFGTVVQFIENVAAAATQYTDFVFSGVTSFVQSLFNDALSVGSNLWEFVRQTAQTVLNDAIGAGGWFLQWITDNVINPLTAEIQNIFGQISDIVGGLINSTLTDLFAAGSWVYDIVSGWISDAFDALTAGWVDLLGLVGAAAKFLEWVAGEGEQLWQFFTGDLPALAGEALVNAIIDALDRESDTATQVLDRMFG